MLEELKTKFEEKYKSWKEYKKFIEDNNADLVERQKDFTKRVPNLETKEQVEEFFQLQGEPAKHIHDINLLSSSLLELYRILKTETDFPKEVKEDMEKISPAKSYYLFKDQKLQKVNEEIHKLMEDTFYANIQRMLHGNKQ